MLATNLPILKQKLNELIEIPPTKESIMYKAAFNAFYNVTKVEIDNKCTDPDLLPVVLANKLACEQKMINDAKQFAADFCKGLKDEGFMDIIADEMTKHIKEAQIDISLSVPSTVVSPKGPCFGSLVISKASGASIIIS